MTGVTGVARELLLNEARNLHAIQKNAKAMMLRVIDRLDHYPEAAERLRAHLGDKDAEMEHLEAILAGEGDATSSFKDTAMSAMGGMTAMMTAGLSDDVIKSSILTFGLAKYEIAAYEGMLLLARKAGIEDAVPRIEDCLRRENAMADWLHDHLEPTLDKYLRLRAEEGVEAAH